MKTYVIPTDFSAAANNAVEYGAKLAKKTNGQLQLINIKLTDPDGLVVEPENFSYNRTTPDILDDMSNTIRDTFAVPCSYMVDRTDVIFEKSIERLTKENDLIVMGTNGADDLFQYFFGSNTYHVIENVKCPVLVVPENSNYKPIKKVVYAWDYKPANKTAFLQMYFLLKAFNPEIVLLHISRKDTEVSNDVFQAIKGDIEMLGNELTNIKFDRIIWENQDDFADKMIEYISDTGADILSVAHYERAFFQRIFRGNIIRKLTDTLDYPLLVLQA